MRFWAGAVRGPVLREKESLHAVMQSLAKNLREFGKKCKSGPVTIKDCCALEKQLVPLLQKCQHLEDPPEWVSNFKTAAARFEQSVSVAGLKWVVDMVKGESTIATHPHLSLSFMIVMPFFSSMLSWRSSKPQSQRRLFQ